MYTNTNTFNNGNWSAPPCVNHRPFCVILHLATWSGGYIHVKCYICFIMYMAIANAPTHMTPSRRYALQSQKALLVNCSLTINTFKPEFTIVIFIHHKPRIAVAIPDLWWIKMTWSGWQMKKILLFLKQFHKNFCSKTTMPGLRKLSHSSEMRNDALIHREGLRKKRQGILFKLSPPCFACLPVPRCRNPPHGWKSLILVRLETKHSQISLCNRSFYYQ